MRIFYIFLLFIFFSSCSLALKIKTGQQAYDLKHYKLATELLKEEYQIANTIDMKMNKAELLAKSFEEINLPNEAYIWYKQLYEFDKNEQNLVRLAKSYSRNGNFKRSKEIFTDLYKTTKNSTYILSKNLIQELEDSYKDSNSYSIENLEVNSSSSDYAPVLFENEYLVFVTDRENGGDYDTYSGRPTSDILISNQEGSYVYDFSTTLNSKFSEGPLCFHEQFSKMFFTRCESINERDDFCRIYQSERIDGEWLEAEPMLFFNENVNVGHPAYLENDSILIFSVKEVNGNSELYYSQKSVANWSTPEAFSSPINSQWDELFPTMHEDTLYFSSSRNPGYGGLDLYSCFINKKGNWTSPVLLKPPFNSGSDDFSYNPLMPTNDYEQSAYLSSNRVDGKGMDDIYLIQKKKIENDDLLLENVEQTINVYFAVKISDTYGKALNGVEVDIIGENMEASFNTNDRGFFITDLKSKDQIKVAASKDGYFVESKFVNIPDFAQFKKDTTIQVNMQLEALEIGKEIVLQDIFYDLDKYAIREDAKPSLNQLTDLLNKNPSIQIELSAYTDCRADEAYNLTLSNNRAKSARNYLISKGINPNRVEYKGYGETLPRNPCECSDCTEEDHQANRRTSFRVIGQ